ncbi:hypothetical protein F441_21563 [Phytophthora nicotianae CJ01A1]|uniref:Uncharacterized protein n=4 Tax=Phytophthora nicotianae TaxID=4792 RepID=V9DXC7_PHYNI|nr:hypothetical protein F443_21673 [Phytophthora nicotianae P1569]ETK71726.1 hypothetical protein L915_21077 [Phytophthora nicotianae]ETP01148.1 hypothetical protein F441_21563 [Phytophthora nicotianae CJ01A1]ETP29304.1 hypothetical protein F442_21528 [Phytophthora nicotianae P10297]ETL25163.1 hypothetical protein L916_20952 [Phytophthora nicotianae]
MVFWFAPTQDREMMRALIRLKLFAAERGTTLDVCEPERLHHGDKVEKKLSKKRKEADLAQFVIDIVSESNRRRAHRQIDESDSDDSHLSGEGSSISATERAVSSSALRSRNV